MRDLLIFSMVIVGSVMALRRPWIGVMVWTWLSVMNPHRYAFGIAYDAPLAAIAAASLLLGVLMTKDRESPLKGPSVVALSMFIVIMTISWLFGLDPAGDYMQWNKVMKVLGMTLVGLMVLHNKQHIFALLWVSAGSLALLGAKGGVFTLATGGNFRVWGPPGSFIEDNNEFALALVMTIPLLRFLQLTLTNKWQRHALTLAMLLCAFAAVGTYSRGALLAISAMTVMLWWRGKNRAVTGVVILTVAVVVLSFMPEGWVMRMQTIDNFEQDRSAMGRISAWWNAWNLAFSYPFGIGFNAARPELFARFSPYPDYVHAAHSIYFQILGNHGFPGLILFLMVGAFAWRDARWLRKHAAAIPQARWASNLGGLVEVSMLGYAVGGAFLSLAYFDLPYILMTLVVLTKRWVQSRGWEREPVYPPGWRTIPGLAAPPEAAKA